MRIGYACLTVAVEDAKIKTCTLKNATEERLLALAGENLRALERMVDYNIANGISLYRISSDIVPFGSSLAARLPWDTVFQSQLSIITRKIKSSGMRVSMHPGQYTVLNSPDTGVVCRAIDDLTYHARFLDALGLDASHKIILHAGGKYGDTVAAMARFVSVYRDLDPAVKQRLVLENDGSIYAIDEVLELCARTGTPAVYPTTCTTRFIPHPNPKATMTGSPSAGRPGDLLTAHRRRTIPSRIRINRAAHTPKP